MKAKDALRRIKMAWVAGVISALLTLIVSLLPLLNVSVLGFDLSGIYLNILGALFVGALAFGISRKSRICAVVMLGYFSFWKTVFVLQHGLILSGLWTGVLFLYCYIQGVKGTFDWHNLPKDEPNNALEQRPASSSLSNTP